MAKWFRSEPMEYISIIMNEDAAHDCLGDLGKLGVIQFTDVRLSEKCISIELLFGMKGDCHSQVLAGPHLNISSFSFMLDFPFVTTKLHHS